MDYEDVRAFMLFAIAIMALAILASYVTHYDNSCPKLAVVTTTGGK